MASLKRPTSMKSGLATGLSLLEVLAGSHEALGVTELADILGIDKANAHRTLAQLISLGYAEQHPVTKRYSATVRVVELARSVLDHRHITAVAAQHLQALWAASRENTHLAVLAGDRVVYIAAINGPNLLAANAAIGSSAPVHCTATGKAIVANLPPGQLELIVSRQSLERFTPTTITDYDALAEHLARVRAVGHAIDDREYDPGVRCVASPVFGIDRAVIGSIGISAPADRLDNERLRVLLPIVMDTAARVSRELGGPVARAS